jgi:hypothetical protein
MLPGSLSTLASKSIFSVAASIFKEDASVSKEDAALEGTKIASPAAPAGWLL